MFFKLSDVMVYLAMIPAALTIVGTAIFLATVAATGVAAVIIGVGQWLASN